MKRANSSFKSALATFQSSLLLSRPRIHARASHAIVRSFPCQCHHSSTVTHQYPGASLALRHIEEHPCYGIGFPECQGSHSDVLQMREVAMMMLMDALTDKPNWHEKVFDEAIVQKWRGEALKQPENALFAKIMLEKEMEKTPMPRSRIISEAAFDYCIAELRSKAEYFVKSSLIPTLDAPNKSIVKSDSLINEALRSDLLRAMQVLRKDQEANVDWHPRSSDMVQHLIHPSMYPFVYGRSHFIQEEEVGVTNALEPRPGTIVPKCFGPNSYSELSGADMFRYGPGSGKPDLGLWSANYQWLPSNVTFREDGTAKLTSYVNNLNPHQYMEIYKTIEQLIDRAIPAWDQCLSEIVDYGEKNTAGRTWSRFSSIVEASDSNHSLWTPKFTVEDFRDADIQLTDDDMYDLEDEAEMDNNEEWIKMYKENDRRHAEGLPILLNDRQMAYAKWRKYREPIFPEPNSFSAINYTPRQSLREKFNEHGLQIIVKMASIELTPEKPEFPVGSWHLEGQMNEKIAATALYYIDSENVTPSSLTFKCQTSSYFQDDVRADQDQYNWLERVFGTSLGNSNGLPDACIQNYGEVKTPQGRLLAFPNVFQHCVSSFKLQDPTKPGQRRFIALWLVDPHRRIISTANVPPQQMDWWTDSADDNAPAREGRMTVEEAREHRLNLMDERTRTVEGPLLGADEYNFCEH